jgi:Ulp1 family protease
MLKWRNESYHIGNDAMVFKFMELSIVILQILWDKKYITLSASHIKDNTHLADIQQNIRTTHFHVLFRQDVLKVKPYRFMEDHQLNCFASSAIHQLDHFVPGSKVSFHAIDCGFMNNLYCHTSTTRNVYNYNNFQRWVKKIKLLDYDYDFIPTNNNNLHWVLCCHSSCPAMC